MVMVMVMDIIFLYKNKEKFFYHRLESQYFKGKNLK